MEAGTTAHATVMCEHVIQESEAWTQPSLQRKHRGPGIGGTPAQGRDEKNPDDGKPYKANGALSFTITTTAREQ